MNSNTFLERFLWRRDAPSMSRLRECRMNLCSQLHRRWTWHPLVGHAVFLSRHWLWLTTAWCKALLNRPLDRMCMRSPKLTTSAPLITFTGINPILSWSTWSPLVLLCYDNVRMEKEKSVWGAKPMARLGQGQTG